MNKKSELEKNQLLFDENFFVKLKLYEDCVQKFSPQNLLIAMPYPLPEKPPLSFLPVPRIIYVLDGHKKIECADGNKVKILTMKENDVIYAPPYGWSNELWQESHTYISVVFHESFIRFIHVVCDPATTTSMYGPTTNTIYHSIKPASSELKSLLQFLNSYALGENGADAVFSDVFKAVLRLSSKELKELVPGGNFKASYTFDNIRAYLYEHSHLPINRKTAAEHFNLSPCYISRLFTQKGFSFNDILTDLRLANARNLLDSTQLNIEEIAFMSGFSSAGYFIRVFASRYKMPPGAWRSAHCSPKNITDSKP